MKISGNTCVVIFFLSFFPIAYAENITRSLEFVRLSDGKVLKQENPDLTLSPASVTKLLITGAALHFFTPEHTFSTSFYYTGALKKGVVTGDLIVTGEGDPYITNEKLWEFVADLRAKGIKGIAGNLIIDNSLFDDNFRDPARSGSLDSSESAYDAPISAFAVNFNTLNVSASLTPDKGAVLVQTYPVPLKGIQLISKVSTGGSGVQALQLKRSSSGKLGEKYVLSGRIGPSKNLAKLYQSVGDPLSISGMYLAGFLEEAGILFKGSIISGLKPKNAQLLATLESYPISYILKGLNTYSNNFIADMLTKKLGSEFFDPAKKTQGSFARGIAVISNFMHKEIGINDEFTLLNGSGLSPKNRLSARQVNKVLRFVADRLDLFPEFLASLPASGLTGTLKKRLVKEDAMNAGKVRAKTGSLSQPIAVASIAGYFRHPSHGLVAFTIIENGVLGKNQPTLSSLRHNQDKMLGDFSP